eukprot:2111208-Rhodomonas_salina.1
MVLPTTPASNSLFTQAINDVWHGARKAVSMCARRSEQEQSEESLVARSAPFSGRGAAVKDMGK